MFIKVITLVPLFPSSSQLVNGNVKTESPDSQSPTKTRTPTKAKVVKTAGHPGKAREGKTLLNLVVIGKE